jgi:hypothetical protein
MSCALICLPDAYAGRQAVASCIASLPCAGDVFVCSRKHPILLQGPTSSGKTSLVAYLAAQTGHTFLRINNHEHTDLQEYLGVCACACACM